MRFATEQRRPTYEVQRAARYCSRGVNNSRNRIETLTTTDKLQYEEMVAGIEYDANQGKIRQQRGRNREKNKDSNSTDKGSDNNNKVNPEIKRQERQQAEQDTACWFVKRLGNMPQDRLEGAFRLLEANLNSASSRDVREHKISNIHQLIET
jgi:hypothetical protein